jgi:hypothetical protein
MAGDRQRITAHLAQPLTAVEGALLDGVGQLVESSPARLVLEVPRGSAGRVVGTLEQFGSVVGVSLTDPPLEDTLRELYRTPAATA